MQTLSPSDRPYKELTLLALMTLLSSTEELVLLNLCKTEFYHRFRDDFYKACYIVCSKNKKVFPDWENQAEELFQGSMLKAMAKLPKFKVESTLIEKQMRNSVRGWLNTIANHAFLDMLRENKKKLAVYDDYKYTIPEDETISLAEDIKEKEEEQDRLLLKYPKFKEAWEALTEKELVILTAYINSGCIQNNHHLPDEIMKDLTKKFGITSAAIRQVKFRVMKKIQLSCST